MRRPPPPLRRLPPAATLVLSTPPASAQWFAAKILEDYPWLAETGVIDVILPKKQDLILVKL